VSDWMFLFVVVTAVIVGADASSLGAGQYKLGGWADTTPLVWGLGTALLWIIVFPAYLITRPKLVAAKAAVPVEEAAATRKCAVCDQVYDAQYDGCPHCAKANA
jgi:hypothetical protein